MANLLQTVADIITLKLISVVFLVIAFLWLVRLIIKKRPEYLFRASLVLIILFLVFIFFERNELGDLTIPELKKRMFPEKLPPLQYYVERENLRDESRVQYVFQDPKPRIVLTLGKTGEFLHFKKLASLNAILKALDLPKVNSGVPELASITGSKMDVRFYHWNNYELGILIVERDLCQDKKSLQSYHCVNSITVRIK